MEEEKNGIGWLCARQCDMIRADRIGSYKEERGGYRR
jgi:hypothetical protein